MLLRQPWHEGRRGPALLRLRAARGPRRGHLVSLPCAAALCAALWIAAPPRARAGDLPSKQAAAPARPFGLAIHGGAGNLTPERLPPPAEQAYRAGLERALAAGYAVLERGGAAVDAVEAAVRAMEDDPVFNAGLGATLTRDGTHELDAALMDGRTLAAGAVAGVKRVKNPVGLARAVMDRSPHVLLIGEGAEAFAQAQGIPLVANESLRTQRQWEAFQKWKEAQRKKEAAPPPATKDTVGAVALDRAGHLAAATSTGGILGKLPGRVGDAPLVGAGTYADDRTAAVSCTGWGEFFIRSMVAYDVTAQMAYQGAGLEQAAQASLARALKLGGDGGLVAIDPHGNLALPFNTKGMARGFRMSDGRGGVELFGR